MKRELRKGQVVTWMSCHTLWTGKILLVYGKHIQVEEQIHKNRIWLREDELI
jgi:hypothetical protein